ncbi:MAG: hypothetical protein IJ364_05410 [Oscillospiraceae bacterium]|nr:hypothetical protein [Oscillospiraceae bacterium]
MNYADINKRYTEIVAEYISKGYTFNTISMSGSQGETAKIDLTNGTEIIRVMVDTFSDWSANVEGIEIIVGRVVDKSVKPHDNSGWNTIWNNQLEVITTERYYRIGRDSNHYGTQAEAEVATALRVKRYIARESARQTENITGKAMDIAKRIIRREFGIKRICEDDIMVSKFKGVYTIGYKSKVYRLH